MFRQNYSILVLQNSFEKPKIINIVLKVTKDKGDSRV